MKNILIYCLIVFAVVSCNERPEAPKQNFVTVDGIDASIKPGDNFFMYVNKTWYDTATIADDQVGVGSYSFLNIPQKILLQNILQEVSSTEHSAGSIEQKVGDFYASGMDTMAISQLGYSPIVPILDKIDGIKNMSELMSFVAEQIRVGDYSLISFGVYPDNTNSSINIAHFGQTGLGLPDRDYYFNTDSSTLAIQSAYKEYLITIFELTGSDKPQAQLNSELVYSIEKMLAESHKSRVERRDVKNNFHNMAVAELDGMHRNINWSKLLDNLGLETDTIDIRQPAYFDRLDDMLSDISIDQWKVYLKANSIGSYDQNLSDPFKKASFEYSKVLSGRSTEQSRAQFMANAVDRQLGFALGQLYVKRYFTEEAKKRALVLVNNLQKAFENRINELDWMSDSTKLQAKEKLYAITKKVGYPDVWREYDVTIARDNYFENILELRQNDYKYEISQLNKAPNKEEWGTTPSTVTAYYNPSFNEIVFPAGILQFPYFDVNADDAINYGGIGMVIGHELTHAFDDQGAQFDKDGNVKNWWTTEDYEKFKAKTQQVIDRYSSFTVLDSVHLKGALTVGENTADNGGIAIAYDAFKLTEQGQDTTRIDGFTPDQRFFLSIAQIWRVKTRNEYLRTYVNTNPHSPPIWRVNGPLMNFTPFYTAFNVRPGEANYKPEDERIRIW